MDVTLHSLTGTRKSLEITVPASQVDEIFGDVITKVTQNVKLPGFRPGKVSKKVLMTRFKKEIHHDVAQQLIDRYFWDAALEKGVTPISQPTVGGIQLQEGQPAVFRAEFDVPPIFDLPNYKGRKIMKRRREITEEALQAHMEELRQKNARLKPIDAPAELGHAVLCDIHARFKGQKQLQAFEDQLVELGSDNPFDKELLGAVAEESRKYRIDYPSNLNNPRLAGETVFYEVLVKEVRQREVPELNDDFAKDLGYDHLEALKEAARKELEDQAEREAVVRMENDLLDELLYEARIEAPKSMVQAQVQEYINDQGRILMRQGIDPRRVNWRVFATHREADAERAVKSGYLLQLIGNAEQIDVADEEMDQEIRSWMEDENIQIPFEEFKERLVKTNAILEVKGRIRTDKIFQFILAQGEVQEEILDEEAYKALQEKDRKRDLGLPTARFDGGGVNRGGDEQEGGEPASIKQTLEAVAQDIVETSETVEA